MVASISARKSGSAAVAYFKHMAQDEYYTGENEADGEWEGRGAERLALEGAVSKADFEAALNGFDPKTGDPLVQLKKGHAPGWDMTYSAPKSVSVMWALSPTKERQVIEAAHRQAVSAANEHLEDNAAWTRRGKGGAQREQVAGLVIARFHHHTSRDLDPQLHTHSFIFNTAPRRDGSWGSIVSRDLYKAQKQAGAVYREHLANALEREGYATERYDWGFRLKAIPREIERAFSKRRQAIEQAADTYGYKTPRGMEMAALRTRQAKRPRERAALFEKWKQEARALGFDLQKSRLQVRETYMASNTRESRITANTSAQHRSLSASARHLISSAALALQSQSRMQGIQIKLQPKSRSRENERDL